MRTIPLVMVLMMLGVHAHAARPPQLVRARMVADVQAIQPGQPFHVGVVLDIAPRWHIYWTNPGDAGSPTTLELHLPEGFSAGPVLYPVPEQFMQPGDIGGYGYHNNVMLMVQVTPPADLPVGQNVKLGGEVRWVACDDVCIPGRSNVEIDLPVAEQSAPRNRGLFDRWLKQVPRTRDELATDWPIRAHEIQCTTVRSDTLRCELVLTWNSSPEKIEIFPAYNLALIVSDVTTETRDGKTHARFDIELLPGQDLDVEQLPVVVGYETEQGEPRGVELSVALGALRASRNR